MPDIPENINAILQEFISGVQAILGEHLKKIILYGSYARGDYNEHSDIDIMILTDLGDDEIVKYRRDIIDVAYDIESENDFDITISPLLKNLDRFNYWLEAMPFYRNVQKEGIVLNELKNF